MSLNPQEIGPIPEETVRVARAIYPKGNVRMRIRDERLCCKKGRCCGKLCFSSRTIDEFFS